MIVNGIHVIKYDSCYINVLLIMIYILMFIVYIPLCFLVGKNCEATKPPQFFPFQTRGMLYRD